MAKDDILRKASKKLGELVEEHKGSQKHPEQDRRDFISALAKEMVKTLSPLIAGLTMQSKADSERITKAIASIQVNVPPIPSPQVKVPTINVPTPKVTVNPPMVKVPQINVPKAEINFPDSMDVGLRDFNNKRPLPVMMFDAKGKPQSFSMGTGGGGRADFLKIKDILTSTGASIINDAGQLKTDAGTPTLSLDYGNGISDPGETGGTTARMVMATDAIASVNVVDAFGSTSVTGLINSDDRLRVSVETGGSGLTDAELRAASLDVQQASGASWSTNVLGGTIDAVTTITNDVSIDDGGNSITIDGTLTGITNDVNIADGGNSITVDGTVAVSGITNTVAANVVDSTGVAYSGSNPVPTSVGTVTAVTDITNSVAANIVDSTGVAFSGSNPFPTTGGGGTEYADGEVTASPSGTAPVFLSQVGEVMNVVSSTYALPVTQATALSKDIDSITTRPVNVRGSVSTAYVSLTTGTETTFLAANAGNYLDLISVMGANQSDAAVTVDLRMVTAGNVVMSLEIPANATAGINLTTPYPQSDTGNNWTVDMGDITGTTVDLTGLFSIES